MLAAAPSRLIRCAHVFRADAVETRIYKFLYSDETGLPVRVYREEEVEAYATKVYHHVFRVCDPTNPSLYRSFPIPML